MPIINRLTGKEPTPAEMEIIRERAKEIFRSPYSSLEQMAWAIEMYPEGFSEVFTIENRPAWVENKLLGIK